MYISGAVASKTFKCMSYLIRTETEARHLPIRKMPQKNGQFRASANYNFYVDRKKRLPFNHNNRLSVYWQAVMTSAKDAFAIL